MLRNNAIGMFINFAKILWQVRGQNKDTETRKVCLVIGTSQICEVKPRNMHLKTLNT